MPKPKLTSDKRLPAVVAEAYLVRHRYESEATAQRAVWLWASDDPDIRIWGGLAHWNRGKCEINRPLFLKRWPPKHSTAAAQSAAGQEPSPEAPAIDAPLDAPLRPAPDEQIHTAIKQAYTDAERGNQKPPNKREAVKPVQAILRRDGFGATGRQIEGLAGDARHKDRRLKRGVSERVWKINKGIQ